MERDAAKEVSIDKFALDEALENQPDLYLYWAEEHVSAMAERNALRRELLEEVRPKLELEVRTDIKKYVPGVDKVTEGTVSAAILLQPEYVKLNRQLDDANNRVNDLSAIRDTFDQRRSSLKYLVELWTRDYYGQGLSRPQTGETVKVDKKTSEEQRQGIEKTMSKRVKRGE